MGMTQGSGLSGGARAKAGQTGAVRVLGPVAGLIAALTLGGCVSGGGEGAVSRMLMPDRDPLPQGLGAGDAAETTPILRDLQSRRSVLAQGSAYGLVAAAVLAADSRAAEAELRSARLRARAQSRNWLPSVGPQVSLSSLGSVIAMLAVEQVLFDNGRKQAERDFAKADVEVAAVALSQDGNARVLTGLTLYLAAQEARDKAGLAQAAARDMGRFEWIMAERVAGGISDGSDLQELRQKLAEIRATEQTEIEAARAAQAELAAMAERLPDPAAGDPALVMLPPARPPPLSVRLAEAEETRAVARARIDRAGFLPSLTASAAVGRGAPDPSVQIRPDRPLGFGIGDEMRAIEAATEGARRKVAQAREEASRRLARLEQEQAALLRQAAEAAVLAARAKANLDLFQAQYDAGQRQVMDVVGLYEQFARQQQAAATLRYRAALTEVQIAARLGLLADGDRL